MSPEPSSQESKAGDRVEPAEVFKFFTNATLARIQLQHKCGEMSLQVTAALGALMAALITAFLSRSSSSASTSQPALLRVDSLTIFIRGLFALYALIQTLITANYIYHTFQTHIMHVLRERFAPRLAEDIHAGVQNKEEDAGVPPSGWRARWLKGGWLLVRYSQPLIPSCSAILGWLVFLWSVLVWPSMTWGWFLLVSVPVVCIPFLVLRWLHKNMDQFARYECLGRTGPSNAKMNEH